jgi:hypothetical protein
MWSTAALVAAGVVLVGTCVGLFLAKDDATERRLFWSGVFAVLALGAVAVLHRGTATAVAVFIAGAVVFVLYAFLRTNYLKIGGTVYNVWSLIRRER